MTEDFVNNSRISYPHEVMILSVCTVYNIHNELLGQLVAGYLVD
jgi:hypothetical protein